jgi:hypothetical protein
MLNHWHIFFVEHYLGSVAEGILKQWFPMCEARPLRRGGTDKGGYWLVVVQLIHLGWGMVYSGKLYNKRELTTILKISGGNCSTSCTCKDNKKGKAISVTGRRNL